jgi:uncharacterized protein YbjT (DUF2867 family)
MMPSVLLIGSSGLVGRHVLQAVLQDSHFARVVALGRRALPPHPKLESAVVDFASLPETAGWWMIDSVISTFGTTIKDAGSQAAFRTVDLGYNLAVAQMARRYGAGCFVLNSSLGADAASRNFYLRTKGELEEAVCALGYPSLTIARPGLLGGERDRTRPMEAFTQRALRAARPLLPRRYRLNPAPNVAYALVDAVRRAEPGVHFIASETLA